ncbi:MAG: YceI family protein [Bacteroidota bacterium]
MKNLILTLLLLVGFIGFAQTNYKTNTENAILKWKGFKPTGSHYGTINLKDGFFTIKNNKIVGGEFIIEMNSIVNLDLAADNAYNKKLVDHLKSNDFFDVTTYPTAKFIINSSEEKEGKTLIKGKLTLKDKTNPVEFLATVTIDGNKLDFKSDTFKIDRSKWNVTYKSKSFFNDLKDKFIDDEMELTVEVKASK